MRDLILGTAGHIDHGKTALVRALTGVDTDRLQEEKARGITIDLGFAELPTQGVRFGVVDVPGHEGFVRNMLAGASGMDVVLLVVAADEGVMPQTREHLAIVELLGVRRLVVALTKADLVEADWLELVEDEVRELLAPGPFAKAPVYAVSTITEEGLEALRAGLAVEAQGLEREAEEDLAFLPVDRVFTVRGTGTVVTGTLWTGRLEAGARVHLRPGGLEARIRGLQRHGEEAAELGAGSRGAVALTGDGISHHTLHRGQALVDLPEWPESTMLTVRVRILDESAWSLEQRQRVRVHLGTAEVMARCVLLEQDLLGPGEEGWAQLRLEEPVVARVRQRLVLRSYSPIQTFAGGEVAEIDPVKRRASRSVPPALEDVLSGAPADAVAAALSLAGPAGVAASLIPVATGLPPKSARAALHQVADSGAREADGRWYDRATVEASREALLARVDQVHQDAPHRRGAPVEAVRAAAPGGVARALAELVLGELTRDGVLAREGGVVARAGFEPELSPAQESARSELRRIYREAGLQPPAVDALPGELQGVDGFEDILLALESAGELVTLEAGLLAWAPAVEEAAQRTATELAGREGLGPADFKEVLPVTRRYLLPLLRHFDGRGITRNSGDVRAVPPR